MTVPGHPGDVEDAMEPAQETMESELSWKPNEEGVLGRNEQPFMSMWLTERLRDNHDC